MKVDDEKSDLKRTEIAGDSGLSTDRISSSRRWNFDRGSGLSIKVVTIRSNRALSNPDQHELSEPSDILDL